MLFRGWILLVWAVEKAEPTAEGREASRQMDPHAHRCHVAGVQGPLETWGWDHPAWGQRARRACTL